MHIPYASSPLAIIAILQGDVQFACVPAVAVMPQVKAGKLRPLAVSTAKRSALTPDIPTMKEAGLPEIENVAWMALMAPASTPTTIVERMNHEINAVLRQPDVKEKMAAAFMEPAGGTPADLAAFMPTRARADDAGHQAQRRRHRLTVERRVACRLLRVRGRVQGVGFRDACVEAARTRGLVGWVRNRRDGSVELLLAGDAAQLRCLCSVAASWDAVRARRRHRIERRASTGAAQLRAASHRLRMPGTRCAKPPNGTTGRTRWMTEA